MVGRYKSDSFSEKYQISSVSSDFTLKSVTSFLDWIQSLVEAIKS